MVTEGDTPYRGDADEPAALLRSESIFGARVRNRNGEDLGHIRDILVDVGRGRAAFVVLSSGGLLGEKYFAFPWKNLTRRPERGEFVLDVEREQLENTERLRPDEWPVHGTWEHTRSLMPYREE